MLYCTIYITWGFYIASSWVTGQKLVGSFAPQLASFPALEMLLQAADP